MHFSGAVACWLQSVEPQLTSLSWDEFSHMLKERFGKDQHGTLVHQLLHIKQQGSVTEYIE